MQKGYSIPDIRIYVSELPNGNALHCIIIRIADITKNLLTWSAAGSVILRTTRGVSLLFAALVTVTLNINQLKVSDSGEIDPVHSFFRDKW